MGIPCRVHVPGAKKPLTAELEDAKAFGAEIMEQWPGHNSVIIARARADAKAHSYTNIPFGMECMEAVNQTRQQVANIPPDVKRIVIPVGSGMSLAGVLWGLNDKRHPAHVLGIVVGANPAKRLNKFAPNGWHRRTTLMEAGIDYHKEAPETVFEGINLDPIYEAKCIPFMEEGDLLWIVGIRRTAEKAPESEGTVGTNNIIAVKNTKQHKDV
jgi:1-aminocyclopropane-1-carboxylate deaminase/D-cysteine desulfhydrase-like pyridoxal-dependent ACC family enzyme